MSHCNCDHLQDHLDELRDDVELENKTLRQDLANKEKILKDLIAKIERLKETVEELRYEAGKPYHYSEPPKPIW